MRRVIILGSLLTLLGITNAAYAQEGGNSSTMAYEAYQAGKKKAKAKEYEAAIEQYQKAIEVGDPDKSYDANIIDASRKGMAAASLNMGTQLRNEEDFQASLDAYLKALKLGQESGSEKVVTIAKNNGTRVAYVQGNRLKKEEKYEDALEVYNQGIKLDSTFYKNYIGRAQSLEKLGKPVEAMNGYLKAGNICLESEEAKKSEKMFRKAENMIAIQWNEKNQDNAEEMASTLLEQRESGDAHYYLGKAMIAKGMANKAMEHAERALELAEGEETDKYMMLKAGALEAQGKTQEAIEAYKKVGGKYSERAEYKISELGG